jgi:hypothetical protein
MLKISQVNMAIENIENGGLQIYWENIILFSNEFSLQLNKLHVMDDYSSNWKVYRYFVWLLYFQILTPKSPPLAIRIFFAL